MGIFTALTFVLALGLVNCSPRGEYSALKHVKIATHADGVEEREYDEVVMPSYTAVPCLPWNSAQSQGYFHLSMYTRYGFNSANENLRMGVPVILAINNTIDVEPRCGQLYTTYFYVSNKDLPTPNNTMVSLGKLPDTKVYVMNTTNVVRNPSDLVLALRVKLNTQGLCYNPTRPYIAYYSSPSTFLRSLTEVWLPVETCHGVEK